MEHLVGPEPQDVEGQWIEPTQGAVDERNEGVIEEAAPAKGAQGQFVKEAAFAWVEAGGARVREHVGEGLAPSAYVDEGSESQSAGGRRAHRGRPLRARRNGRR
jgi:hypothetical protein